jgi:hypothetical protein
VKEIDIANPVLLLNPYAMHSGPISVYSSVFLFNSCNFMKMAECYVCLFILSLSLCYPIVPFGSGELCRVAGFSCCDIVFQRAYNRPQVIASFFYTLDYFLSFAWHGWLCTGQ